MSPFKHKFQKLHIKGDPPPKLPKTSYFIRFESHVLENRREACLKLLQHAGSNPILYSSQVFAAFLSSTNCPEQAALSPSIDSEDDEEDRIKENSSGMAFYFQRIPFLVNPLSYMKLPIHFL